MIDGVAFTVSGSGPPMLLYHGLLSTELHWRPFIAHYSARYRVVSFHYPGHGESVRPATLGEIGIAAFAERGHRVLAHVGARGPAIVCALSMGVQSALEHVRSHPEEVRALVLLCGTYGRPFHQVLDVEGPRRALASAVRGLGHLGALLRDATGRRYSQAITDAIGRLAPLAREMAYLTGGAHRADCPREVLDELFHHVAGIDVDVMMEACASYFEHDASDVLPAIRVPVLVIAGEDDRLTPPAIAERMVSRIPDATLHVAPGRTHLAQVERPEEIHAVIDRFLVEKNL